MNNKAKNNSVWVNTYYKIVFQFDGGCAWKLSIQKILWYFEIQWLEDFAWSKIMEDILIVLPSTGNIVIGTITGSHQNDMFADHIMVHAGHKCMTTRISVIVLFDTTIL